DGRKPGRLFQRFGTDHDALDAPAQGLGNVGFGPQPAAELARHVHGSDYAANAFAVNRPALLSAVEVDQVKVGCALLDPAASHGGGIAAEPRFLVVIALPQPHALTAAQVDGRQKEHAFLPIRTRPARLDTERLTEAWRSGIRAKRKSIERAGV